MGTGRSKPEEADEEDDIVSSGEVGSPLMSPIVDEFEDELLEEEEETSHRSASAREAPKQEELYPTVFSWPHGGQDVYLTGSFNGWQSRIPLNKSGSDFTTILYLPPGEHRYKFIVDDDWSYSPEQNTVSDESGNISNSVEVESKFYSESEAWTGGSSTATQEEEEDDEEGWSQRIPDLWVDGTPQSGQLTPLYAKDPPFLPPHLFRSVLDGEVASKSDPSVLPVPHHVMLNHLYTYSQSSEDVAVFGQTQRYRKKFITTIYFSPANPPLDDFLSLTDTTSAEAEARAEAEAVDAHMNDQGVSNSGGEGVAEGENTHEGTGGSSGGKTAGDQEGDKSGSSLSRVASALGFSA